MSHKIVDEASGEEIEVFTAAEVQERETAAATAKEAEFTPKLTDLTEKLTDAEKRAQERSGEFAQFRKLTDDAVAKLSVAERTIYENGLALNEANERAATAEKNTIETRRDAVITAKANGNAELVTKMKEMWPILGIDATTPEQIEAKAKMILGALSTTVPDLVATANGFQGGSYTPPMPQKKEGESYADTEAGKAGAAELGLIIEAPK